MSNSLAGDVALLANGITNVSEDDRESVIEASKQYLDLDAYIEEGSANIDKSNDISLEYADLLNNIRSRVQNDVALFKYGSDKLRLVIQVDSSALNIIFSNKRVANPTSYIFIIWVLGSALVLIILSVGFLRGQVRSILFLSKAAENFGKGREMRSFKPSGAKEIRLAGIAFIEMKERIKRLINSRTQTLVQVSQDIKTIIGKSRELTPQILDGKIKRELEANLNEMQNIIDGYMHYTLMESPEHHIENLTEIDLKLYLDKVTKSHQTPKTRIKIEIPEGIYYSLKPEYFARSVNNLIDNAAKYASNILIRAQKEDKKFLHIFIDDDGEGIPDNKIEKVFQPFYKLDANKHKETGGVGLGLTIARDIIHKHGGDIKLSKSHLGGLRVTISLPY
ncbi:MAG: ATP-binding protein [Rickettsiales bacterium]|nr:ATP-binding protein [Rickettsiales bacterium]